MSVSPSESREEESEGSLWWRGGRGVGAVIVKGIVDVVSWLYIDSSLHLGIIFGLKFGDKADLKILDIIGWNPNILF